MLRLPVMAAGRQSELKPLTDITAGKGHDSTGGLEPPSALGRKSPKVAHYTGWGATRWVPRRRGDARWRLGVMHRRAGGGARLCNQPFTDCPPRRPQILARDDRRLNTVR